MKSLLLCCSFLIVRLCHPQYLYVTSGDNTIHTLDLSGNCSSTYIADCGDPGSSIKDIAVDVSGNLYVCRNDSVFVAESSGCRFVTNFDGYKVNCIEIGPDGRLYAIEKNLLRYNFFTGELENLGELPGSMEAGNLVFYINKLFLSTPTGAIYDINLGAPAQSPLYYDTKIPDLSGLAAAPARCFDATSDELRLFAFGKTATNQSAIHIIDVQNKITYYNHCLVDFAITGNTGFHPSSVVAGQMVSAAVKITPATCSQSTDGSIEVTGNSNPSDPYTFSVNNTLQNQSGIFKQLGVGNYLLSIENKMGCIKDTLIAVPALSNDCMDSLFVPTAFTPDNDGLNDFFRARSFTGFPDFRMQVYNRNGQQVFQTNSITAGWDGTINNVRQNAGMYIWYIEYTNLSGKKTYRKGYVVLVR